MSWKRKSVTSAGQSDTTLIPPPTGERLRSLAFALLARREWSRHALSQRLVQTGAEADEVEALLQDLIDRDYQSDDRMAAIVVREQVRKGRGPLRIKQALQKENLTDHPKAQAQYETVDFLAQARAVRARRFGDVPPQNQKEKARQYRYLLYRGYDAQTCQQALQPVRD